MLKPVHVVKKKNKYTYAMQYFLNYTNNNNSNNNNYCLSKYYIIHILLCSILRT